MMCLGRQQNLDYYYEKHPTSRFLSSRFFRVGMNGIIMSINFALQTLQNSYLSTNKLFPVLITASFLDSVMQNHRY
jgi:hypothetical protein